MQDTRKGRGPGDQKLNLFCRFTFFVKIGIQANPRESKFRSQFLKIRGYNSVSEFRRLLFLTKWSGGSALGQTALAHRHVITC